MRASFWELGKRAEHAGERSELCRLNLLLHRSGLDEAQKTRNENHKAGYSKHKSQRLCVPTFGPHLPVVDRHGEEVVPSKQGHPLGPNRALHLPAHLLEIDDFDFHEGRCPAIRFTVCTVRCCLCKGYG